MAQTTRNSHLSLISAICNPVFAMDTLPSAKQKKIKDNMAHRQNVFSDRQIRIYILTWRYTVLASAYSEKTNTIGKLNGRYFN